MSFADPTYSDAKNSINTAKDSHQETISEVVMCFGTFDIFHPGHAYYLSKSQMLAKKMIVVIARDHRVISGKWKTPIHSENERLQSVGSNFPNATVILGDEHDIFAPLREYSPDILAFGYDQRVPEELIIEKFPQMEIVRIEWHETDIWKSSILRKNHI
jgi:FAD synthetase